MFCRSSRAVAVHNHILVPLAGIYDTYNQDNKTPMLSDPTTDVDLAIVADR